MSHLKDLTGQQIEYLFVQYRLPNYRQANGRTRTRWQCLCTRCGKECVMDGSHLLHHNVKSCGCLKNEKSAERMRKTKGTMKKNHRTKDLTGLTFGKLTVKERAQSINCKVAWLCVCECGNEIVVRANHLLRGLVRSCGCTASFGEEYIRKFLTGKHIRYSTQFSFSDLVSSNGGCLRFDFAIFNEQNSLVALLEYQGEQHDAKKKGDFGRQQREETDQLKIDYCNQHHIPLYHIWYNEDIEYELWSMLSQCMSIPCQASYEEGVTIIPSGSSAAV